MIKNNEKNGRAYGEDWIESNGSLKRVSPMCYVRSDKYGECYKYFWIFPKDWSDKRIETELCESGVDVSETRSNSAYDCTGRWFHCSLHIMEYPKLKLATQSFYLDV